MYGFSNNTYAQQVGFGYDVLFLCLYFLCDSYQVHAYSHDTYILVARCMKQNKDAVCSLVLLLVTGVSADPKHSYSYDTICKYVRIVNFLFFIEIFHSFNRYLLILIVVGSRYDFFFGFNNMRHDTCRSDFVRYQAKT